VCAGGAKEEGKDSRVEVVVRLELGGRPVWFTRILPESRSTSLLIRCVCVWGGGGLVACVCVCVGGGDK
jgi:hypothetical protein